MNICKELLHCSVIGKEDNLDFITFGKEDSQELFLCAWECGNCNSRKCCFSCTDDTCEFFTRNIKPIKRTLKNKKKILEIFMVRKLRGDLYVQ
jgi:hypothetical protein